MRTETITRNLYTFDELSEEAKDKALDNLRDVNLHYEWWHCTYETLKELAEACNVAGFEISGFNLDRAQTISLSGSIDYADLQNFAKSPLKEDGWKKLEELQTLAKSLLIKTLCPALRSAIATTYANGWRFEAGASFERTRYAYNDDTRIETEAECASDSPLMIEQTEACAQACADFLDELKDVCFKMLSDEHEYLYSDDAVKDTIEANEYEFNEDGDLA